MNAAMVCVDELDLAYSGACEYEQYLVHVVVVHRDFPDWSFLEL